MLKLTKLLFLALAIASFCANSLYAQTGRDVHGIVTDSTKLSLPGSTITLTSDQHDSTTTIADVNGKFAFSAIKGSKISIVVSSIGFQSLKRHYTLASDNTPADLGTIVLKAESQMLNTVTIVGSVPVTIKEDTVQYQASAYKVRENAPVEDLIKSCRVLMWT